MVDIETRIIIVLGWDDTPDSRGYAKEVADAIRKEIIQALPDEDRPRMGSENYEIYRAYSRGFNTCLSAVRRAIGGEESAQRRKIEEEK